ncbi:uncharacterized protein LOC119681178 [Teleopsis dalmanni]|uniref:uncharacterized protein LOC119681178 n=1 Tax=Teleopsis dalmanni TaxID=139649 RepID=UPI0018CD298F|nr:uncharacterized protein LOC119681178 [Teleopsis dalmanni]
MQKYPIPEYKTTPQLQAEIEILKQQRANQSGRKTRNTYLPARRWIQRNPKLFQISVITGSLLIFFSKPLYDIFIAEPVPPTKRVPPHLR